MTLEPDEYLNAIDGAAASGVTGGGIYDAILGQCALKARAQNIYTWSVRHFERLGTHVAGRVKTP